MSNNKNTTLGNRVVPVAPSGFSIDLLRSDIFRQDDELIETLGAILAPSYKDHRSVLLREITHGTHLYLGKDDSEILCFYLLSWEQLNFYNGDRHTAVYMGLSATRQDKKNIGMIRHLYTRAMSDACEWERHHDKRVIAWATMATPTSYLFSKAMLSNVQPSPDGSFTEEGAKIAHTIRQQHGYGTATHHPFVLHAVADNTLYSETEVCRIQRVIEEKSFYLFEHLDIQERRGDRLLIVGQTQEGQSILSTT